MSRTLIVNPRDDAAFVDYVETADGGTGSPGELEARLRKRYPEAVVRPRDLAGEQHTIWYVYRDGHWTPSPTRGSEGDGHV